MIDYNHFKPHHSLRGETPAEVVGVSDKVQWGDSWEDITRMGGEIAEPRIKDIVITPQKPGPKPKGLEDIAAWYHEQQAIKTAKPKIPKGYKKPVIASYKSRPKPKANKGRGQWGKNKGLSGEQLSSVRQPDVGARDHPRAHRPRTTPTPPVPKQRVLARPNRH